MTSLFQTIERQKTHLKGRLIDFSQKEGLFGVSETGTEAGTGYADHGDQGRYGVDTSVLLGRFISELECILQVPLL